MNKLELENGNELRSLDMPDFGENDVIPKLILIVSKDHPTQIKLSDEIKAELIQCCQPGELPFVQASIVDGVAVSHQYRSRKP